MEGEWVWGIAGFRRAPIIVQQAVLQAQIFVN